MLKARFHLPQFSSAYFSGTVKKNYYEILGISRTATKIQIRAAYVELSKKFHPDTSGLTPSTSNQPHEKFVEINEAYRVLSKDESRLQYDRTLSNGRGNFGFERQHHKWPPEPPQQPGYGRSPFNDPFDDERFRDNWDKRNMFGNRVPFGDVRQRYEYYRTNPYPGNAFRPLIVFFAVFIFITMLQLAIRDDSTLRRRLASEEEMRNNYDIMKQARRKWAEDIRRAEALREIAKKDQRAEPVKTAQDKKPDIK